MGKGYQACLLFKLARVRERWPCEADWTTSVKKDLCGNNGVFSEFTLLAARG